MYQYLHGMQHMYVSFCPDKFPEKNVIFNVTVYNITQGALNVEILDWTKKTYLATPFVKNNLHVKDVTIRLYKTKTEQKFLF